MTPTLRQAENLLDPGCSAGWVAPGGAQLPAGAGLANPDGQGEAVPPLPLF